MKKLYILTATAGILLALVDTSLAASRTRAPSYGNDVNTVRTYGERDEANTPSGRHLGRDAYARQQFEQPYSYAPSRQSYPSADPGTEYGGPNGW